jgi:hypothetical protein
MGDILPAFGAMCRHFVFSMCSPPGVAGIRVAHLLSFLCCVIICFVCPRLTIYLILPVFLNCPFLIAPSLFSNVY